MNLIVTCEQHFERTPDGQVWTNGQAGYGYECWARYLSVFDAVRVVARTKEVRMLSGQMARADGSGVAFDAVPDYRGPWAYLLQARRIAAAMRKKINPAGAVILRVPGQIGSSLEAALTAGRRPFAVEVVGDPYEVFGPGINKHPLRPFFQWLFTRRLRLECARACAAAYVTEKALQRRYPPSAGAIASYYSDVELPEAVFRQSPRAIRSSGVIRLLLVGSLSQMYKAPDVLIKAVAAVVRDGINVDLTLVGGGQHQTELEHLAAAMGIGERVTFRGQLAGKQAVRDELNRADLFVLPSRTEGLPRALLEAMAEGLPCIGSTVGGIPELLESDDMVPPNDPVALSRKIREVVTEPQRMVLMSARNLMKARQYSEAILVPRRRAFYERVKERTNERLAQTKS